MPMQNRRSQLVARLALAAGALAAGSCVLDTVPNPPRGEPLSPSPKELASRIPRRAPVINESLEVEAITLEAEVVFIDPVKRTLTLLHPDGQQRIVKAAREMKNFDKINVGDKIFLRAFEEMAVFVRKKGDPPSDRESAMVALNASRSEAGVVMAETVEITARVESVDAAHQQLRLRFADGAVKTLRTHHTVNLADVKPGDDIVARMTEHLAIEIVAK